VRKLHNFLEFAGIDLKLCAKTNEFYSLEANPMPAFTWFQAAGKVDISGSFSKAEAANCYVMDLDAGVPRFDAHRFCMRERFRITSHHFEKVLHNDRPVPARRG
jgi:hypothetical protein